MIVEASIENLDSFYEDFERTCSVDEGVVLCPMDNPLPIIPKSHCINHLVKGRRLVGRYLEGKLTHVLLIDKGRIRTCFARMNKSAMQEAQWEFVDYFNSRGEVWHLDTGTPGWVNRTFFEDYAPGGGPFDISVHQPGLPDGTTYSDFDDREWTLTIHDRNNWVVDLR